MKKSIFLFFAAILCAMTANAYNQSAVDLYFDNSEAKWSSCYVYIGHGSHTCCYPLSRVSGTQYLWTLAKANFNGGNTWGGATGWVLCKEKWWDKADESIDKYTWHGAKNVTKKRTSAWSASYIYKTNGTASVTSDGNTINAYNTTTVSNKNYTVTINTVEGGTLTVKDYDDNAVATGASKIYLTVLKFSAIPASGYVLDAVEINDGTNTTTIAAADLATKTHTLTSNVTITPVWRATTSTVTVTATATNGTVIGGGVVEAGTSVTLSATPAEGYKFVNWTVGGAEVSTANPYTFTAEEDVTVVANFEEIPTHDITVKAFYPASWNAGKAAIHFWGDGVVSPGTPAAMEKDGDWWSYTVTGVPTTSELSVIFINGDNWNGDANQTNDITGITESTCFQITSGSGKASAAVVDCASTPVVAEDVYTVVGSDVLLGTAWDLNNADNEMTKQDDGSYVLVKENVDLATTGTYEYKVVKNHDWGWSVPSGSTNNTLKLGNEDVDGTYNVTFTLNKELNALTASLELVEAKKVIPECYVAGDESLTGQDWNAKSVSMTYDEATEVYTATLTAVPAGTHNMKVVYGGEWLGFDHLSTPAPANVKEGEDKKIQFTLAEAGDVTVTYHATNGIGLTGNFAVPAPKYYIAGTENLTGFDWKENGLEMTKEGDVYKHTFSEKAAGTYEFKVTNGTWTDPWGYNNLGAAYEEVSQGVDGEGNPNGNIKIVTEEAKNITVIFDATAGKITFEGLTPYVAPLTYTVTVPAGTEKCYIAGAMNGWNFQEMTATANANEFTIEIAGARESDGYKYACKADWDYVEKKEDGNDLDANRTWKASDVVAKWGVPPTYTIVGATAITGENWNLASTNNIMIKDGEAYTLTKTNLQLEAGDYGYKVAKNGAWGDGQYPAEGNQTVTIAENGVYTIVYTYTVGTSLTAVATKTGEYTPVQTVYTVAGDAALCGSDWKADDAANDMTANGDGTFTWKKTDVKLTSNVGFKVVKNHDFGNGEYPAENWNINLVDYEGAAVYTVTITFTDSSKEIAVTLTKTGEATPPVITYVLMGVNGDWDNGIALTQNPGNEDEYVLENQVIIKATDAVKVVTLTDGTATAWCGNVDAYSNAKYTADAEGNIVLEDGIYTFYFKKNDNLIYINQTGYVRNVTNKYGTICLPYASVSTSGAIFYRVAGKEEGKVYLESVDALEAGVPYIFEKTASQIKVVYTGEKATTAGSANGLVGTFNNETEVAVDYYILKNDEFCLSNGNAKVNANRAYLIMEDINGGAPQQMPGRRYIGMSVQGENEATGFENITNGENTTIKLIENGQLIIIRNGEKFNAQGVRL